MKPAIKIATKLYTDINFDILKNIFMKILYYHFSSDSYFILLFKAIVC